MEKVKLPGEWLIIGCGSLVGSRFAELIQSDTGYYCAGGSADRENLHPIEFSDLDVTNLQAVEDVISKFPGKYIINFAGATIVDEIEKSRPKSPTDQNELDQNMAYRVNVIGTKNILQAAEKYNKFPIFISTGFVYDSEKGPYSEDDSIAQVPDNVGWYAWTKALAEKEVAASKIKSLVIRISYPYRSEFAAKSDFARNFITLYDAVQKGEKSWYPIFADQTLTPTFIDDLPEAVKTLVENNATGVYNVGSPDITTPYDFCCEVLKVARGVENPEKIVPKGSIIKFMQDNPNLAKRLVKGGEKVDKIQKLGFTPTSWKQGIQKAFSK